MKNQSCQPNSEVSVTALQRGDAYRGGLFVGIAANGVVWVAYEGTDDFNSMCETFDSLSDSHSPLASAA